MALKIPTFSEDISFGRSHGIPFFWLFFNISHQICWIIIVKFTVSKRTKLRRLPFSEEKKFLKKSFLEDMSFVTVIEIHNIWLWKFRLFWEHLVFKIGVMEFHFFLFISQHFSSNLLENTVPQKEQNYVWYHSVKPKFLKNDFKKRVLICISRKVVTIYKKMFWQILKIDFCVKKVLRYQRNS